MLTHTITPLGSARRQSGYTFVELLVAVIMIGLLSALMIPAVLGQREKAEGASAESLLRTAASSVESAAVDSDGYVGVTTADLSAEEPNVHWLSALGATATAGEVSITAIGPQGYTLSTTSASGQGYVLVKDLTTTPTITRTCGPGCTW